MHGDGRQRGEEMVKHEVKKDIAAVHVRYYNRPMGNPSHKKERQNHQLGIMDEAENGDLSFTDRLVLILL